MRTAFSTVILASLPVTIVGVLVHFSSFAMSNGDVLLYLPPIAIGSLAGSSVGSKLLMRNTAVRSRVIQGFSGLFLGLLSLALFLITVYG